MCFFPTTSCKSIYSESRVIEANPRNHSSGPGHYGFTSTYPLCFRKGQAVVFQDPSVTPIQRRFVGSHHHHHHHHHFPHLLKCVFHCITQLLTPMSPKNMCVCVIVIIISVGLVQLMRVDLWQAASRMLTIQMKACFFCPGGGFNEFLICFHHLWRNAPIWWAYFSNGWQKQKQLPSFDNSMCISLSSFKTLSSQKPTASLKLFSCFVEKMD